MKKVLFYINNRKRGGAQRVMVELANYLSKNKLYSVTFTVQFPSSKNDYGLDNTVTEKILETPVSKNGLAKQKDRIQQLELLCKEEKPDLIISFLNVPNLIALIVGKKLNIPVIISIRSDPSHDHSFPLHILMRIIYPWAAGWVFQTENAKAYFKGWIRGEADVIINPLSERLMSEISSGKITDENKNNIVTAGRLSREKRHDLLIKAYHSACANNSNIKLVIYGEGPEENNLRNLIQELALNEKVILAGVTDNIIEKIRCARLFVFSSEYEGLPNALIEAMAVGLPVIATDCPCGGPATLIRTGINGILVPVNNETELAKQIERLLNDIPYALQLGKCAKEISSSCNIRFVAKKWCSVIERCLQSYRE